MARNENIQRVGEPFSAEEATQDPPSARVASDTKCLVCGQPYRKMFEYRSYTYHRCTSCGQVATLPIPTADDIREHYRNKFQDGNYRLARDHGDDTRERLFAPYITLLRKELARSGKKLEGKELLDIGCFTGEFLTVANAAGASVWGVDLQDEAIAIANQRFPGRAIAADVTRELMPDRQFDIVTIIAILEHVPDPIGLLEQCYRLVRPGGIFLLETPDSGSLLARMMGKNWIPYAPVEHLYIFTRRSLSRALSDIGFEDIRFSRHWKTHRLSYCFEQLRSFSPEIQKLFRPLYNVLPKAVQQMTLRHYIGEMIAIARKPE